MNGNSTAQTHFTMEHTTKTQFECSRLKNTDKRMHRRI